MPIKHKSLPRIEVTQLLHSLRSSCFSLLPISNSDLGIGVTPPAHPRSLRSYFLSYLQVNSLLDHSVIYPISVPRHRLETVHQQIDADAEESENDPYACLGYYG